MDAGCVNTPGTTAAERLALRLDQDMRRRGLGPGDRYMTAAEAGRLLNVSRAAADRAMAVLAERQLLVRRNVGSFGGPKLKRPAVVGAPTVYVLAPDDVPKVFETIIADEMISALRQTIGVMTGIHFCFLPHGREMSHVQRVIKSAQESASPFGVIACSCIREVYQYLTDNAVPSVVIGTPYAGQDDLPCIDHDHLHGGRLLMEYLIRRGHDRMAALFVAGELPGDNDFLHGLHDAMSDARRLPNTLRERIVPRDPLGIAAEVQRLMTQPDRPTALITMLEQIGDIAVDVASGMGLAVPGDFEVVFSIPRPGGDQRLKHTHLRHAMSLRQLCEQAGAMLDRLWQAVPLEQKRVVIPAELRERQPTRNRGVHQEGASSC